MNTFQTVFEQQKRHFASGVAARGSAVKYEKVHRVLGEGDFVLVVSEGTFGDRPQLNGRKHAGNPVDRHQTPVRQSR
jgi:aspartate aminotransferase-like enzyme